MWGRLRWRPGATRAYARRSARALGAVPCHRVPRRGRMQTTSPQRGRRRARRHIEQRGFLGTDHFKRIFFLPRLASQNRDAATCVIGKRGRAEAGPR